MTRRLLGAAFLLAAAPAVAAQCSTQSLTTDPGSAAGDGHGRAVLIRGADVFVGQPHQPQGDGELASVDVLRESGGVWTLADSAVPYDGVNGEAFGWALDANDQALIVGAPQAWNFEVQGGVVYPHEWNAQLQFWQFGSPKKLLPSDHARLMRFGESVALDGDRLAVGAPGASTPGLPDAGAAYLFERVSGGPWQQVAKLLPTTPHSHEAFGSAVALAGDLLVVGAPGQPVPGSSGRVVLFQRQASGTWEEIDVLHGSAPLAGDLFGQCLALQGGTLVVSASREPLDPAAPGQPPLGAVYAYGLVGSDWVLGQKLVADDPDDLYDFGSSLSLRGDRLAVGSTGSGLEPGAVHVFDRPQHLFTRVGVFDPPPGMADPSSFGAAVAVDAERLVVGCPEDDSWGSNSGEAFLLDLGQLHETLGQGTPGSGGLVPELFAETCGPPAGAQLTLSVDHALGGAAGALLVGASVQPMAFAGGVLYPSQPWRLIVHALGGQPGVAGAGSAKITVSVPAVSLVPELIVQALYVDDGAPAGWSQSRGLRVDVLP